MNNKSAFKFYFMQICGLISLLAVLLPWMSYGVGSKTGIDIARISLFTILVSGALFLVFTFVHYKFEKVERGVLYLAFMASFVMFGTYLFELIRITYQTTIAKNLPIEMFGAATLATAQIHIGYGLWLGLGASFLPSLVNIIVLRKSAP